MKPIILKAAAVIITLFALITLFMSTSVIFDLFGIRAKEGIYRKSVGYKITFNHNNNPYCEFCWFVNSRKYRWNLRAKND